MIIVEVGNKYGHSVDTLDQEESVDGKHKIQRHSINIRRELWKM
jgi:hypothetical protein